MTEKSQIDSKRALINKLIFQMEAAGLGAEARVRKLNPGLLCRWKRHSSLSCVIAASSESALTESWSVDIGAAVKPGAPIWDVGILTAQTIASKAHFLDPKFIAGEGW